LSSRNSSMSSKEGRGSAARLRQIQIYLPEKISRKKQDEIAKKGIPRNWCRYACSSYGLDNYTGDNFPEQFQNAIDREVYSQARINSDWAEWDDTYLYMKDKDEGYIDSNFDSSTFMRLKLNGVLFIDSGGQIVFSRGHDIIRNRETPFPESLAGQISGVYNQGVGNINGLTMIDGRISLITTHLILKSDGSGPQKGILVMIRYLDESQIEEISLITGLNIDVLPMDNKLLAGFFQGTDGKMETRITKPINITVIQGYGIMNDIYAQPQFLVKIEAGRAIYLQGLKIITYFVITILSCAIILGILLSLALDRVFIRKLKMLNRKIDIAANDETNRARIYLPGNDEFSELAAKIDRNLHQLRQSIIEKRDIIKDQEKAEEDLKNNAEELKAKTETLEKLNRLTIGRELKMVELKKLLEELNKNGKKGDAR
jgi:adenylate cyclase